MQVIAILATALLSGLAQPVLGDGSTCYKQAANQCTLKGHFNWDTHVVGHTDSNSAYFEVFDGQCKQIGYWGNAKQGDIMGGPGWGIQNTVTINDLTYPDGAGLGSLTLAVQGDGTIETVIMADDNDEDTWVQMKAPNCDCTLQGQQGCQEDTCCICTFGCSGAK